MNLNLAKLVVFSILMENGEGIAGKAPLYILEKWRGVELCGQVDHLLGLLDQWNHHKYVNWLATWSKVDQGLIAEEPSAEPAEAKTPDITSSAQSESVQGDSPE